MNWLDRLEKKHPRFGITNITFYLVACNAFGFLLETMFPKFVNYIAFDAHYIFRGQIWRLVTWLLMPSSGSYFTAILFLLCAVSWGRSLEQMIGTFRVTVFIIGGIIINVVGGLLFYFISGFIFDLTGLSLILRWVGGISAYGLSPYLSAYYLILTILMEIALIYPDGIVRFWFILPMKMKWMFWITAAELAYEVIRYFYLCIRGYSHVIGLGLSILMGFEYSAPVIFAMLNLLVFYLASKNHISRVHKKRQKDFRQQYQQAAPRPGSGITKHKCAVCGKTEVSNPELMFRYCSKCPGGYEYCSEHLFTHTHH